MGFTIIFSHKWGPKPILLRKQGTADWHDPPPPEAFSSPTAIPSSHSAQNKLPQLGAIVHNFPLWPDCVFLHKGCDCAHYHLPVHLSQRQSEQTLPKSSTLWLSSSAGGGSHCPSPKGLLRIASEIIKFFFAKHSTIELVGYYNGESKWTHSSGEASMTVQEQAPGLWKSNKDHSSFHGIMG